MFGFKYLIGNPKTRERVRAKTKAFFAYLGFAIICALAMFGSFAAGYLYALTHIAG